GFAHRAFVIPAFMHGQADHYCRWEIPFDPSGGFDTVHAGHVDVHHNDVGFQGGGQRDRLMTVGGLADDLEFRMVAQHAREAASDERVIVHKQHADPG